MSFTNSQVEVIFHDALEQTTGDRGNFVKAACNGDTDLQREVEQLLAAHEEAGLLLAPGLTREIEDQLARLKPEESGDVIGPYKLLEQLGEGGFGTVWVAEQERPVRRRVALKLIKLGMDTKEVIARFEQERQALAVMDHPHIAKVFDAGTTQWGRPYFVMELVRGIKITEYCDQENLSTVERVALFIQVCHAVQHAHQKGIIHRDLKPSNILVTLLDGEPMPKVIDFGVAKAMQQQRLTDQTIYTQFQQMIGTPLYMSPEQAELSGLEIDVRSDVYSLGVLLYELLTGRTPFDAEEMMQLGLDEIRRTIREVDPPTPSMLLRSLAEETRAAVARHRRAEPAKLVKLMRGDLDWIVMKALEKDRGRRYDSAASFAADLDRHLRDVPVQARPASRSYRMRRFVKRNRAVFATGTVAAFFLAAILLVMHGLRTTTTDESEVQITTESAKAQVWRDGILVGVTPFRERIRGKEGVSYILKAAGFVDLTCPVVTPRGRDTLIAARLFPIRANGEWEEVKEIRGVVKLKRDGAGYFTARVGDRIARGDNILVEKGSSATVGNNRTMYRLGEGTELQFSAPTEDLSKGTIFIKNGAVTFSGSNTGDGLKVSTTAAMAKAIEG